MRHPHKFRSPARWAALLAAGALALTACGQADNLDETPADDGASPEADADAGAEDAGDGDQVTIRFSWWGSDSRHQMNQDVIDLFEDQNPDIKVVPDYTDWGGYWDKLATQTAGGDTPDVMMQEERYVREYADRGVLADLSDAGIDTSKIDDSILAAGQIDGSLWTIPTGVNVRTFVTDPQVFEDAGVDMPDDTTWTWQDYHDAMVAVHEGSDDLYGAQDFGFLDSDLQIWLRQHGQNLWDESGNIGFDAQLMADFWQMSLDLHADGGAPDVSESLEIDGAGPEQSLVALNTGATARFWSNQLGAISGAAGRDLTLLRFPGETEFDRTGVYLKPAMSLSMSAKTEHPEAAAKFIDFMLNSPEVGEIILTDRGLPANLDVREHILGDLDDADQVAADFIADVTPDIVDAPPPPPAGAGEVAAILARYNEQVMFGQTDPLEAAEAFIDEATAATSR